MLFGQFSARCRCRSGAGCKDFDRGFKTVYGWPWGVTIAPQYALWRKGSRNGPFGRFSLAVVPSLSGQTPQNRDFCGSVCGNHRPSEVYGLPDQLNIRDAQEDKPLTFPRGYVGDRGKAAFGAVVYS